ncbi:MAG: PAS domain-containing protein [Candidatus Lokiarchaeota archaeon]|nr:PAS domain-containing protein [Candidatus Lokiarchaeota archaeon]
MLGISGLYESEELFKELIENISSGVAIYETTDQGKNFTISEMNKAGLSICDVTRKEIIGKNLSTLFPKVEDFVFLDALRRVWKTGNPEHSPTGFYQASRVSGWTEIYIYKLSSGKVVAIFDQQSEIIEAREILSHKKIEEELQKSETEKSTILESLLEFIVYQTKDNSIIWANKAAADSVNSVPEELVGRKCYQVWNDRNDPCEGCPVVKSLKSKKPEISEINTPDDRVWRVAGYPVKDNDNNIIGVVETTLDITERRTMAQKVEERSEALSVLNKIISLGNESKSLQEYLLKSYDQVLDIVGFDRGGIYFYNNKTNHNILVYHKNIHPDYIAAIEDVDITQGLFSKVFDKDKLCYFEDFSEFMENSKEFGVYSTVSVPLRSKDEYVGSLNLTSPTHQILSKNKLDLLESIGKQMGIIIQKFESEKLLKESEEKFRKAFLQADLYRDIFAHDINNILQNIHSSAELSSLYLNNPEKLNTISELYEIIHEQVERGRKLIKNVRKINEIEDSEIELEKIEIFQVLNKAIEFLKNSFQARTLDVKINSQKKKTYVYANNLLLDVFDNILINAVRHNSSTKIEIEIEIKKEKLKRENYIRMEFNDNGLGISDYRKKSIFEKGKRKSQRSRGLGLGLSLVKKIVDSYQGDIWVEDRTKGDYKQGSKFVVLLHETL